MESFYYMWRTTGDEVWRERGWAVFRAIEKEARTESGYASLWSVLESPARHKDEMPRWVVLRSFNAQPSLTVFPPAQLFHSRNVRTDTFIVWLLSS